jgi:dihydrofolate synthase / folylpolyglutamate synthase
MNPDFSTIEGVEDFLEQVPKFGTAGIAAANFNLDRMRRFCEQMGNPERKFQSIHVAGTNGKGTVCQMLASVYQGAGYKTGLYTSPHLLNIRERFRIDSADMGDEHLLRFFALFGDSVIEEKLTFFELTTAIAFWYFADQKCDIAIIETGLGGRLDATNVITPECSVITSVGMDHADILGDTIGQIAAEKAGIIKKEKPVIAGNLPGEAHVIIKQQAKEKQCPLHLASECRPDFQGSFIVLDTAKGVIKINAAGRKKIDAVNTAIAWQTVQSVSDAFPVSDEQFKEGIEKLDERFPRHGHFEKLLPDRSWYFDGAHNEEATEVLTEELLSIAPAEKWTVVLSFMKDKLTEDVAGKWRMFPRIFVFAQQGGRAATAAEMKAYFPEAEEFDLLKWAENPAYGPAKSELVIFSGSFYFYEKVRRWMGTTAAR